MSNDPLKGLLSLNMPCVRQSGGIRKILNGGSKLNQANFRTITHRCALSGQSGRGQMDNEMRELLEKQFSKIDERFTKMDERFTGMDERFDQINEKFVKIDERFTGMDEKFTGMFAENKRYFGIIAEELGHQIQQVAEGIMNVDEKLDREVTALRHDMQLGFDETKAMIKFSYADLDRRVRTLEDTVFSLHTRMERLEMGQA